MRPWHLLEAIGSAMLDDIVTSSWVVYVISRMIPIFCIIELDEFGKISPESPILYLMVKTIWFPVKIFPTKPIQ